MSGFFIGDIFLRSDYFMSVCIFKFDVGCEGWGIYIYVCEFFRYGVRG